MRENMVYRYKIRAEESKKNKKKVKKADQSKATDENNRYGQSVPILEEERVNPHIIDEHGEY